MMFTIDYKRLALQLLPYHLRKPLLFGLLRAALAPFESLYSCFLSARSEHIYRLTHNGQVCYLRACLNDHFKSTGGGKFEIMSVVREGEWLYAISETGEKIPLTLGEDNDSDTENVPVVYNELMLNEAQNDFVVSVPADIYDTQLEAVKALVDKYKLISKRAIYISQSA